MKGCRGESPVGGREGSGGTVSCGWAPRPCSLFLSQTFSRKRPNALPPPLVFQIFSLDHYSAGPTFFCYPTGEYGRFTNKDDERWIYTNNSEQTSAVPSRSPSQLCLFQLCLSISLSFLSSPTLSDPTNLSSDQLFFSSPKAPRGRRV